MTATTSYWVTEDRDGRELTVFADGSFTAWRPTLS